jgi:hypothetical protein
MHNLLELLVEQSLPVGRPMPPALGQWLIGFPVHSESPRGAHSGASLSVAVAAIS